MYEHKVKEILYEIDQVFKRVSSKEVQELIDQIVRAEKVVLIGVGREGLSTKAFTMRLMHLGVDAHWIWDETTPSISTNDLLVATNGCGDIGHIDYVVKKAKKIGAAVSIITGNPYKATSSLADTTLFLPASVYLGTAEVVPSNQPMGNLFEQSLLILFDIIVMELKEKMGVTKERMEANHRNLE